MLIPVASEGIDPGTWKRPVWAPFYNRWRVRLED